MGTDSVGERGKSAKAFQPVEEYLVAEAIDVHDLFHLIEIGPFCRTTATPAASAVAGAPSIAAGPGDRAQARFAEFEQADIFVGLALHAHRIFRVAHRFSHHQIGDDSLDLFLFYGAAEDLEVHLDEIREGMHLHGLDGKVAVHLLFDPVQIAEAVFELVDPAKAGAGTKGDQNLGMFADLGEPGYLILPVTLPSTKAMS